MKKKVHYLLLTCEVLIAYTNSMENEQDHIKHYITAAEAARLKGVTLRAMLDAIKDGKVRGGQYGARFLVEMETLPNYQPRPNKRREHEAIEG